MIQYYYIEDEKIICSELIDGYEYLLTKSLIKKGLTIKVNSIEKLTIGTYFVFIDTRNN